MTAAATQTRDLAAEKAAANGAVRAEGEGNVYQRALAVSRALEGIVADGHNSHLNNDYISIKGLTNALRPICVAAGLHITSEVIIDASGQRAAITTLTNVDAPDEKIVQQFACETPKDQGGSYITKYALMKLFLVADDTDPDSEATGGRVSGPPPAPRPAPRADGSPGASSHAATSATHADTQAVDADCPLCDKALKRKTGKTRDGKPFDFIGCSGYPDCKFTDNDVASYLEPKAEADPIDPDDIPF